MTTAIDCRKCGGAVPPKPADKPGRQARVCNECKSKSAPKKAGRAKYHPGDKFGYLTMIENPPGEKALWRCDCGAVKMIRTGNVVQGKQKACSRTCPVAHPVRTYDGAHTRMKKGRGIGSASLYRCSAGCGRMARDWAYLHSDLDQRSDDETKEAGKPYGTDPTHYAPLCRRCHYRFDQERGRIPGVLSLAHIAARILSVAR